MKLKLKDLVKIKGGKRLPKGSNLQTIPNKHPYIKVKDMKNKFISLDGLEYVPDETFTKIKNYIVNENDIIISIVGTIGLVSIIDSKLNNASQTENCAKLSGLDYIDSEYLYYFLISEYGQSEINKATVGAVQPKLPLYGIENIEIDWKTREDREKIIYILRNIDNKIELNTQTNQTLEQIAQGIFKHWFIDFAPVHAKAEALARGETTEQAELAAMACLSGKTVEKITALKAQDPTAYHQLQQTAAAFPSEFVETEMGEVPKGWEITMIGNIADIIKGKSYKSSELEPSDTALVTLKSFQRGGGYRLDGLKEFSGKYKPEQEVYAGELIIAYTDVTQAADIIGKPAMVMGNKKYKHLVISLDVGVVRPKNEYLKYFLYCLAMTENFQQHTKSFCSGTTVLHLGKNAIPSFQFIMSDTQLLKELNKRLEPIFTKININIQENESLSETRDILLPKLLNGEIKL